MLLSIAALLAGLVVLVWSADKFVEGAAVTARYAGMPPLLIGMVIVGFGTSSPEMVVSAFAAWEGSPALALGNAYGSNIFNIAFILGVTALIAPIAVHSSILRRELPILLGATLLTGWLLWDGNVSRMDAVVLLLTFFALMGWSIYQALHNRQDALGAETEQELETSAMSFKAALLWLVVGLLLLIVSSRLLVWGAINIAQTLGISDLIIGLTIVAAGTSLPELATSIIATRKNEHDIALGNVVGSNLFNTLAVVGIAGAITPIPVAAEVLSRDWTVMLVLTVSLLVMVYSVSRPSSLTRWKGSLLLLSFLAYTGWLFYSVVA